MAQGTFSDRGMSRIRAAVRSDDAEHLVRGYFESFDGRHFESLGGQDHSPHRVNAIDLVAVTTLSVLVPSAVAVELLQGPLGDELETLLRLVPTDQDLWDPKVDLDTGSPADRAWHLLERQSGMGWVIAGKLLARKRPRMVPVYDRVVSCYLDSPDGFWSCLQHALRSEPDLVRQLERIREGAGLNVSISVLRVLDVLLWRTHQRDHRAGNC